MDEVMVWLKGAAAVIGGVMAYLWGAWDALIIALVVVVVMDYITGVINAALRRELSSAVGFKGLCKKVMIFVIVAVGVIVDRAIPSTNGAVRTAVIVFYIANEGISILENAGRIGVPLPRVLKKWLAKMQDEAESAGPEENPPDE